MKSFSVELGTFVPEHEPEDTDLIGAVKDLEARPEIKKIDEPKTINQGASQRPLTAEEAGMVYSAAQSLRKEIARTKSKIKSVVDRIDEIAKRDGSPEIVFNIDLRKRMALRRAVQKAFGSKNNTLTYAMYLEALRARKELQEEEAESYLGATNGREEE